MAKSQKRTKTGQFKSNRSAGVDNPQAIAGRNRSRYALERLWDRAVAQNKTNIRQSEARAWMRKAAEGVRDTRKRLLSDVPPERMKTRVTPGKLYYYEYSAYYYEVEKTLPYYDMYPLAFPIKQEGDKLLVLSMHYLPPRTRAKLMDALLNIASDSVFNEKTRILMSYKLLNASSKYKEFAPCLKYHRLDRVKTKFIEVPANEWYFAMFLPLARFKGASSQKVFNDSAKAISKR